MPLLNSLLRPHRRGHGSTTTPAPPTVATSPPPSDAANTPPPPSALSALPPLDIGSPDLGSPGQWLEAKAASAAPVVQPPPPPPPLPPTPSTAATATPAPTSSLFSRTSTPYTTLSSEITPKPTPRPGAKTSNNIMSAGHPLGAQAAAALGAGGGGGPQLYTHVLTTEKPEKIKESRKDKLGRLNPMSLLRRKSSQRDLGLDKDRLRTTMDLPDNFDPGIIYGTRHPDWSSHPKRGPEEQRRSLSPVPIGPSRDGKLQLMLDPGDGENIDARISISMSPEDVRHSPPGWRKYCRYHRRRQPDAMLPDMPITPATIVPPKSPTHSVEGVDTPITEGRRGVTLVDHPLGINQVVNSSRFSFEGSSNAPSAAASIKQRDDDDDRSSFADGSFQFDLDDDGDEDDGFARANEGIFEHENTNISDQYSALEAAVSAMQLSMAQEQQGIGMAVSDDVAIPPQTGVSFGTDMDLPSMDPQPLKQPKEIVLNSRKRLANPRGLDFSDNDLDFIDDEQELAGYEDDDDDMYFDDGVITQMFPEELRPQSLTIQPPTEGNTPVSPFKEDSPGTVDQDQNAVAVVPLEPGTIAANRLSMATTGISSGLIPQDGSMATQPGGPAQTFPPFLNPIGGGLGFTQEQHQFYAPNVNGTLLNGMALTSLTHTLQQLQQQQLSLAGAPQSPSEGYDSDINERPDFGTDMGFEDFDYDGDDYFDDEAMVAAANAEALASDSEGFYGSEFGFYPSTANGGLSYAGGFFGAAGANGDVLRPPIRRPSLTPISERSENSYRNSLVSLLPGSQSGWGSAGPLSPGSWGAEQGEELSLGQLLQLRRNAWGGSNGSIRSSGSAGGGGSPAAGSPVGWPAALAAVGMGAPAGNTSKLGSETEQHIISPSIMHPVVSSAPMSPGGLMTSEQLHQHLQMSVIPLHSPPIQPPPGITIGSTPPGLHHAGAKAMLPTKGSFEDPLEKK
ncbi:hypothetical protein BDD12DRAFT_900517 [Trichophaea hybrida]|nr:hypothetical protein BDD12DRAFT_900517 [Trichophaea hybrida]